MRAMTGRPRRVMLGRPSEQRVTRVLARVLIVALAASLVPMPVSAAAPRKRARASGAVVPAVSRPAKVQRGFAAPAAAAASPAALTPNTTRTHTFEPGWNLVTVPLKPIDAFPSVVFSDVSPLWLFDDVDGDTLMAGEPGFRSVVPGRGFRMLIGSRAPPPVVSVSGTPVSTSAPFRLPVAAGWNVIGTPWFSPVEWGDARVSVRRGTTTRSLSQALAAGWLEDIEAFDPTTEARTVIPVDGSVALQAWRGYALFAPVALELIFSPPPADTTPPMVALTLPADGARLTEPTTLLGTADDVNLAWWRIEYRRGRSGAFTPFIQGEAPVVNGVLGNFDTTLLKNGLYQLRLTAADMGGLTSQTQVTVVVTDNQRVGHFSVSFVDVEVPLAGLPIQITRTYDSRDVGRGDFGAGWRLSLTDVQVDEAETLGVGWPQESNGQPIPQFCVTPPRTHVVTVTLPDGRVETFDPVLTPSCQAIAPLAVADLSFAPRLGTLSRLEALQDGALVGRVNFAGAELTLDGTATLLDPDRYRLTLPDGRAFVVSKTGGLQILTDPNGNELVVSPAGILHSSGTGVTFARDGQGRITQVTDPAGESTTYAYDANGDLISATDRDGNTTTYAYSATRAHFLESIHDPLGRQPIRNDYDIDGRLLRHTDAYGKTIEYSHALGARQEMVTDRNGAVRVLEYDARGNVVRETDAEGQVTTRTFDTRNNRLSETDPEGHTTSWTYDAADNVVSATDALGNVTEHTYNARRQVLTTKDALGRVTTNTYDARGNLLTTTDAAGGVTTYTYDARGNMTSQTDAASHVTTYSYDLRGNLATETDARGHTTTYTYDANGNRLTQTTTRTLPGGASETLTTTYAYDKSGRLTRTTDPDGSFTRTVYDALGRQIESHDKLDHKTAYEHDLMGRLVKTTYADGTTELATYDAEGRRLTSTDRAGRVTSYAYDGVGRLTQTTYPDGATIANTYDDAGRLVSTRDTRGNVTGYAYDAAGRRTRVTDALGHETLFTYDAAGNQTGVTDARGNVTSFEHDALNRRTKTVYPDGTFTQTTYDALGRRVAETDQAGRTTQFQYDPLGRLVAVVDALGQTTSYAYDEAGNRVSQTDANGRTTRFEYDPAGRETKRILPDGAAESKTYDAAGNLVTRTDFAGRTTSFAYDLANRLSTRTYPDASVVSFTYTPTGRRLTATDARGTTAYAYDTRDRLASLTYPDGRRLSYAYDTQGNRTSLTASLGTTTLTTAYAYDPLNRLRTITDPLGRVATLSYDANGNRAGIAYPNGVATSYAYDNVNRLTQLATAQVLSGTMLLSQTFTLGAAGNRTRIVEADGTSREYTYDPLYRLTAETITGPQPYAKAFTYDAVGNRRTQTTSGSGAPGSPTAPGTITSSYDTRDRLLADAGARALTYTWDANGNLTARSGEATYAWDYDDRLIRIEKTDGTLITHTYDVDGNRVQTTTALPGQPPQTTDYLVDTSGALSHVVAETAPIAGGASSLKTLYIRADDELLALMRPDAEAPTGWQTRWYHGDGIGSIRALTDEAGAPTDRYDYTAFGERLTQEGTDPQPYAFTAEPLDPNTGWQYHRARWLDTTGGRFTAMDPFAGLIGDPSSLARYPYATNDPIGRIDPTGEFVEGGYSGLTTGLAGRATIQASMARQVVTVLTIGAVIGALAAPPLPGSLGDVLRRRVPRDLYNFGNETSPAPPRFDKDFELASPDGAVGPERPPRPLGKSVWGDWTVPPLTGRVWLLFAGYQLPAGLGVVADGRDAYPASSHLPTHHTIYPTNRMPFLSFQQLVQGLPWEKTPFKKRR